MLKIILISIGAIIALLLLAAAIMDKDYTISSGIVINKPKDVVFAYVRNLKNQEKYSKWVMADPNAKLTYTGTDGTVGFKAAWESANKNVGVGEQEITKIDEAGRYDVEIRFKKPFEGVSHAYTTAEAAGTGQTKATNIFVSRMNFPMNLMIPMMKNMLRKDMDTNMQNLKRILESQ